jgi:predicted RNA-binding protein YlxR (DUF448 family)
LKRQRFEDRTDDDVNAADLTSRAPVAKRRAAPALDERREPERSCVGCGGKAKQSGLLRWVHDPQLGLAVDTRGVAGRGAWTHAELKCLNRAVQGGFGKAFKAPVSTSLAAVCELLQRAATRRLQGLLQAARGRHALVLGRDAVRELLRQSPERVALALLAEDSGSLVREEFVVRLGASGKLVCWGAKHVYGQWLNRGEVAILAITELGLAKQMAHTSALLRLTPHPEQERGNPERTRLPEDR